MGGRQSSVCHLTEWSMPAHAEEDSILKALESINGAQFPRRVTCSGFSLGAALSEMCGVWSSILFPGADVLVANQASSGGGSSSRHVHVDQMCADSRAQLAAAAGDVAALARCPACRAAPSPETRSSSWRLKPLWGAPTSEELG